MKDLTRILVGGISLTVLGVLVLMNISYDNREIDLRNQSVAQEDVKKTIFDKTWKVIKQQAGVTEQYKEGFKEVYSEMMAGRYGNARGGALMSWIKESNPQFDASMFKQLMTTIEALRAEYAREQKKSIDIKKMHDDLRMKVPSGWFMDSDVTELKIAIISSTKTEKIFESGIEDDISVF